MKRSRVESAPESGPVDVCAAHVEPARATSEFVYEDMCQSDNEGENDLEREMTMRVRRLAEDNRALRALLARVHLLECPDHCGDAWETTSDPRKWRKMDKAWKKCAKCRLIRDLCKAGFTDVPESDSEEY